MRPATYFALSISLLIGSAMHHSICAAPINNPAIDDQPLKEALSLPDWFKVSFLEIKEDLQEANSEGRGLIIYFGQEYCPYCKALINNNWQRDDIVKYTRSHFDVIAINVRGDRQVTAINGRQYKEKFFASKHSATFTPTLLFFDKTGHLALKLVGYRNPYQFMAALEYVADMHHRNENFRFYLARAEGADSFGQDSLNDSVIFIDSQHDLQKLSRHKPLAVFFEEQQCHACDVLHAGPLNHHAILKKFSLLNSMQLDMWAETPLITPAGKQTTASKWANELDISYAPTIIFFDESGKEIIRVESVIGFFRLGAVLDYINKRGYRKQPDFQLWRNESTTNDKTRVR
jgi:thioredoxin-related protein